MTKEKNIFNPKTTVITQKGKRETIPYFDRVVTVDYEEDEALKKIKSGVRATSKYTVEMNNLANMFVTSNRPFNAILNSPTLSTAYRDANRDWEKAKIKNPNAKFQFRKILPVVGFTAETIREKGLGNFRKDLSTMKKLDLEEYSKEDVRKGCQLRAERQLKEYQEGIRKNLKPYTITMQGIEKAMAELTRKPKENSNAWLVDIVLELQQAKKEENWKLVEQVLIALREKSN
tara:strand:- start:261 stop:956 length:696 start_codon:yes stop_codon:yes gene_type:complete